MKERKLAILLATYNSEPFLEEQLASLFGQTHRNWILYVRDDGSTDRTLQILSSYQAKHTNIVLLEDDRKNRGPKLSFLTLLEQVDADLYMFCDHDDVWLKDKIALTLDAMREAEDRYPDQPVVVHTDLVVVDEELNVLATSFWKYSGIDVKKIHTFPYLSVCNKVTGCTMMINRQMKQKTFPLSEYCMMHDSWIALNCMAQGGIVVSVPRSTLLYRQHTKNQVGATRVDATYYANKLLHIPDLIAYNLQMYRMARSIKNISVWSFLRHKVLYLLYRDV